MSSFEVRPVPTDEEAAAIAAAVDALWPRPRPVAHHRQQTTLAWRFSGRWWQRDRMAAPERPWR